MECEIIYCFVSRNKKIILSDSTEYTGNFQQVSLFVIDKIQDNTYTIVIYENYLFYIINEGGISYLLLSSSNMKKPAAFSLLDDLKQAFRRKYSKEKITESYSFQLKEFDSDIKSICSFYKNNPLYAKQGALVNKLNKPIEITEINSDVLFTQAEKVALLANKPLNNKIKIEDDFMEQMKHFQERKRKRVINYMLILFGFALSVSIMIFLITRIF